MIGLPISIFMTGDRAKAFDCISVTTVGIDLSIDAMTNFLNAISIHCKQQTNQNTTNPSLKQNTNKQCKICDFKASFILFNHLHDHGQCKNLHDLKYILCRTLGTSTWFICKSQRH